MKCKICSGHTAKFDVRTVRGKYEATYLRCEACHFVFVENPHWLAEAYANPINDSDTGYVARNERTAWIVSAFSRTFGRTMTLCDYGGGYGLFVRLLRDRGVDAWLYEPHTTNLMAPGFSLPSVARKTAGRAAWDAITAFEVFEHVEDPAQVVETLLRETDTLVFSTELQPAGFSAGSDWYYLGLMHGQHISLFSEASLRVLAEKNGASYVRRGVGLHIITRKGWFHRLCFRLLSYGKVGWFFSPAINPANIVADRNIVLGRKS